MTTPLGDMFPIGTLAETRLLAREEQNSSLREGGEKAAAVAERNIPKNKAKARETLREMNQRRERLRAELEVVSEIKPSEKEEANNPNEHRDAFTPYNAAGRPQIPTEELKRFTPAEVERFLKLPVIRTLPQAREYNPLNLWRR